jgi:hypothetical protein
MGILFSTVAASWPGEVLDSLSAKPHLKTFKKF